MKNFKKSSLDLWEIMDQLHLRPMYIIYSLSTDLLEQLDQYTPCKMSCVRISSISYMWSPFWILIKYIWTHLDTFKYILSEKQRGKRDDFSQNIENSQS